MKKINTAIVIVILLISTSTLKAAGGSTAVGPISLFYLNKDWTMVKVTGVTSNPDGCSSAAFYAIDANATSYEQFYVALMAAHISDRDVHFYVSGCGGQFGNYPKIASVYVH